MGKVGMWFLGLLGLTASKGASGLNSLITWIKNTKGGEFIVGLLTSSAIMKAIDFHGSGETSSGSFSIPDSIKLAILSDAYGDEGVIDTLTNLSGYARSKNMNLSTICYLTAADYYHKGNGLGHYLYSPELMEKVFAEGKDDLFGATGLNLGDFSPSASNITELRSSDPVASKMLDYLAHVVSNLLPQDGGQN
jgi:hypothetical protein